MFIAVKSAHYLFVGKEGNIPACWVNLAKPSLVKIIADEPRNCQINLIYDNENSKTFKGAQAREILAELRRLQELEKGAQTNGQRRKSKA